MCYKIAVLCLVALNALAITALPPCVCTRNLRPVCGSDGNTYSNECLLNCENHKTGGHITMEKEGPCSGAVVVAQPPCTCTEELDYVCGSDGNTYGNPCQLNCATANNPSLSVKNHGRCDDSVKVANPELPTPACFCTYEYRPTCGSDGETYSNPCQLNCATAKNPSLRVQHEGSCGHVNVANPEPTVPPCICTDDLNEVCGSDGVTYANPCQLNCATAHNPSLSVQKQGRCESQGHPQGCTCPRDLKPVCGSDGVTYNNMCLLRCAGTHVSLARLAPCELRD